ncbi:MAG: efflux RND transporter periplasmic adaptor subunit, partial [Polyangiales bacterium]
MKRDAEPVDAALQDRDSGAPHTDMQSTDPDASRVAPTRRRGRWKRYLWGLLGLLAIVGGLAAFKGAQIAHLLGAIAEMEKAGPMPEAVNSATVERQRWAASIRAVGTIVSEKGVTITNEVSGTVQSLRFDSGQQVQQGQVLVTLDAGIERAELASVTAKRELAEVSSARSRKLVASGAAPRADLDEDTSALKGLSADERALGAQIAKKVVRAPFAGKLGIRLVSPGQYLPAGTEIVLRVEGG